MTDRGRDTSWELSEIRTVLSRAETARRDIAQRPDQWIIQAGHDVLDAERLEMLAALDEVINRLGRWRRTGRSRPSRP